MNILIAPDSFKHALPATAVAEAVAKGWHRARPGDSLRHLPLADGGEGTAAALIAAVGGEWRAHPVAGPMPGQEVEAAYAWLPSLNTAVVELAAASGIERVPDAQRDPRVATTHGTGTLLREAVAAGAGRIWLTLGGSATNDGGAGIASALGWRFLDAQGQPLPPGGAALAALARIEPPADLTLPPVDVWCDVDNPLTGPRGASAVYGPQKGATPEMVVQLDAALHHFADVVRQQLHREIDTVPGAGAAGGAAAGALAFLDGRLVSGADQVFRFCGVDEAVAAADVVITGEGRFDEQSLQGKLIGQLADRARSAGKPVVVFAGSAPLTATDLGLAHLEGVGDGLPLPEALSRTAELLEAAAFRCAENW